jgi:PAS domain S-box-containing protein
MEPTRGSWTVTQNEKGGSTSVIDIGTREPSGGSIARRLFVRILLLSLMATVLISALQLYFRYHEKLEAIEQEIDRIQVSRSTSIATHLWLADEALLQSDLEGILNLPYISFAEVESVEGRKIAQGTPVAGDRIERVYPLVFSHRGREIAIGALRIQATPEAVRRELLEEAVILSLGEASKIFVIGLLVFILFQLEAGNHLRSLGLQARSLDLERPRPPFHLKRHPGAGKAADELDYLVSALNVLYGSLRDTIESLRRSNEQLDEEIRERKRADQQLLKAHALLEETQAIGKLGGWEYEVEPGRLSWTREVYRIYGVGPEYDPSDVGRNIGFYAPEDSPVVDSSFRRAVKNGEPYDLECRFTNATGEDLWVRTIGNPVIEGGKVVRLVGTFMDITERKRAEEALQSSLHEKELLLKEVHHRVKNNLQVISSLLSLQTGKIQSPELQAFLRDTRNRVRAMALLHETLYRSGNLARVSVPDYVKSICEHVAQSYASDAASIRLRTEISEVSLDLDRAIPAGLIISELVSNALKHAFRGRREGDILVELTGVDSGHVALTVTDDGIGLPEGMDPNESQTLGLLLVHTLTRQLGGKLTIRSGTGTAFEIVFPTHPV